jgi:hypothetical protein
MEIDFAFSTSQALLNGVREISLASVVGQVHPGSLDPGNQRPDDFRLIQSSSPGEFHPQALTDPDVTVSRHPALII